MSKVFTITKTIFRAGVLLLAKILLCAESVKAADEEGPNVKELAALDYGDLSLEQLMDIKLDSVYGASKFDQKISQAPASVTIVTANEIQMLGHRTLADVLNGVGGVYVTYDRNYSAVGMRGFNRPSDYNTRVLLLVDGHRMNDDLYSSALIGTEGMLDVDLIERVEVIRGPSSSIYGNSAFLGVINVVTRKPSQINGTEAAFAVGSFDSYKGRFTYGKSFKNGVELVLSGSVLSSDGQQGLYFEEFNTAGNNGGVADGIDGDYSQSLFGSLSYEAFTLTAGWSRREKQVPTASYGTIFNDRRQRTVDERFFANLKFEHSFTGGTEMTARVFYDHYSYLGTYPYDDVLPAYVNVDDHAAEGIGAELQFTRTFLDRHTVIVGAEYRHSLSLYQAGYSTDPTAYFFEDERETVTLGIYTQAEIKLRDDLLLNGGLRYDYFSNFGGTANPRVGLIYTPWEKSTFKLLYGQAYRAPNAYEMYLESPGYNKSNLWLEPETIHTYELVYEQILPKNLRLNVSAYHYEIDDLITQEIDPVDGLYVFNNVDNVRSNGLEVELEGRYARGLNLRASYALQRTEDEATGEELSNSPRHLAKLKLILPLYKEKLYGGLELQYTGDVTTATGKHNSGFLIANATLFSREVMKNLELSATLYNLFDTEYSHPSVAGNVQDTIPQDGRSFRLKFTYTF
ncbi:iron complex outermembrane receptor protein [Prosthecobacter fusiformis]|uniref:Iron complex outermembrane receptor protein n=1 Tax=Prosthecobacter fusiformis TaxID=48464 RepID=A0A4V6Q583_9BACT|nr:TonB-dependent receptor [Prosthecobacter fusiformis]TDU63190.1 iron complex outermembrane receptor protein [Prosthecobacter fusiformis]